MSTAEQKPLALTLADRLTANAEIDAAEGGNPDVIKLELDAAAELRRLSAENEALRNQSEDRRAQIERMSGYIHTCGPNCTKAGCVNGRLSERLARWESAIGEVMMPDLKDWHDNDPAEWPDIAAGVITTLREQRDEEVELSGQLATKLATRDAELATLRAQVGMIHHALKDAGWHPGRTDDLLTDIIRAKGEEMAALRAKVEALTKPDVTYLRNWSMLAARALDDCHSVIEEIEAESTAEKDSLNELRNRVSDLFRQALSLHGLLTRSQLNNRMQFGKLADLDATPSPLTRPAVPEGYQDGVEDFFLHLEMRAANHWHARPGANEAMQKESAVVMEWARDARRELLAAAPQPQPPVVSEANSHTLGCLSLFGGDCTCTKGVAAPQPEAQPTEAAQKGGV